MKVKVIETGRIDILDLRSASGQDNLPDIIGNQDCFGDDTSYQFQREWDEEEGDEVYLTSQACYEWWVDMISLLEEEQALSTNSRKNMEVRRSMKPSPTSTAT